MNAITDTRELYRREAACWGRSAELGEREVQTIEALIGPLRGNLLDLGCADRHLEAGCMRRGVNYRGIDYDRVDFESSALPYHADRFDIAVSLAVIEHLRDPNNFLTEIKRVLRPGGNVYLSTTNFRYDMGHFYDDPTHKQPYTPESLESLLRLHGFENVQTFPGLRCKPDWMYEGPARFWRARYLLPFRGDNAWAPEFLKGQSRSFFAIGKKPHG